MATGDDLELGATNTANTTTHLEANVPHQIGLLVTNSGGGGTTNPVTAINGESAEIGVRGFGDTGVVGETFKGIGVKGKATGGTGVNGDSNRGIGVEGRSTLKAGVRGSSNSSHGVHGTGTWGVFGEGRLGVRGDGDLGVFGFGLKEGVGVWGGSRGIGVLGSTGSKSGFAGFFQGDVFIQGNLTKTGLGSCVAVPFRDGSLRRLYSIDSPESWFEDFGEARLAKGKAEVTIDPGFAAVVRGAYHVFITPYGDSNGLYVSHRTSKRFVVREQNGGTSTLAFSYRIVAKRKDIAGPRLQKVTPPAKRSLPPARA
ncbi:MAG: hypothetical protein ABW318_00730 [Vicinamibacterales bacterium]